MAALIRLAAALLAMPHASATAQQVRPPSSSSAAIERWQPFITQAAQRFGVPEAWIRAVMKAESGGQTHLNGRPIVSRAGAMGLMQLMPATWSAMRARHGLGSDPHDPGDNIMAGTAYLRAMYDRFGYPGLFAAYNAGPGRYAEHLRTGRMLPAETRGYIGTLAGNAAVPSMPPAILSGTRLFFVLGAASRPTVEADPIAADDLMILPSRPDAAGPR